MKERVERVMDATLGKKRGCAPECLRGCSMGAGPFVCRANAAPNRHDARSDSARESSARMVWNGRMGGRDESHLLRLRGGRGSVLVDTGRNIHALRQVRCRGRVRLMMVV